MSEHERKIDALFNSIARGNLTVDQLHRAVADGKADIKRLGPRIEPTALDAIAAGEEALERIERELSNFNHERRRVCE